MNLISSFVHNVRQGFRAGYRPCCVAWFSFVFNPILGHYPKLQYRYNKWLWWRLPGNWSVYNVQYIPCPLCMIRRSFDRSDPFFDRRPIDATREDYEALMGSDEDWIDDLIPFLDEEPH